MKALATAVLSLWVAAAGAHAALGATEKGTSTGTAAAAGGGAAGKKTGVTLGMRAVVSFSQLFSGLGVTPGADLELGYVLPVLGGRLQLALAGGYLWSKDSGTGTDARLVDPEGTAYGSYSWRLDVHELMFTLRVKARVFALDKKYSPYFYIGPSLYLLWSVVEAGSGGESFGTNTERSMEAGVQGGIGFEHRLGPGRIFGEVCVAWSPLRHDVTGHKSTGNMGLAFGYTAFF